MLWLIGSYLILIFLIPLGLSALVSLRSLPAGRDCPRCTGETIQLLARALQLLPRFRRFQLERRWCLACGWQGIVRVEPARANRAVAVPRPDPVPGYRDDAGFTETVDVRTITIDGHTWRVLLQCWNQTRRCCGRLVFVEPTGRLWTEAGETFTGDTRFEVIGQALTVTDGLLTTRLRRILSEASRS
ncbi:MAG: hypothetical protein ABIV28_00825 [Longimicrobiales bacterium]